MSSSSIAKSTLSSELLRKCLTPYTPTSPPTLHGAPIVIGSGGFGAACLPPTSSIVLSRALLDRAVKGITAAFAEATSNDMTVSPSLLVTAVCSPHVNCLEAVDATAVYLGHQTEADVITLDPADFAAGSDGILGHEITSALWTFYEQFYQLPSPTITDSRVRAATSRLRELVLAGLEDSCAPSRRRILYLRDFGALAKVMAPLLSLLRSVTASGPPMVVLIGVSPVEKASERLQAGSRESSSHADSGYHQFLRAIKDASFVSYLNAEFAPALWRSAKDPLGRFRSLRDIFTAAFVDCYQGGEIASSLIVERPFTSPDLPLRASNEPSRSGSDSPQDSAEERAMAALASMLLNTFQSPAQIEPVTSNGSRGFRVTIGRGPSEEDKRFSDQDEHKSSRCEDHGPACTCPECAQHYVEHDTQKPLVFGRVLYTGLEAPLPECVVRVEDAQRRRRFLDANMFILADHMRTLGKTLDHITEDDWNTLTLDKSAARFLREMGRSVFSDRQFNDMADYLPPRPTAKDVQNCFDVMHDAERELRTHVLSESTATYATSDHKIAQVMADPTLPYYEKEWLHCIVDPTTIRTTFEQVCIGKHIIDTLKIAVSYPLRYPEAYDKGILAEEHLAGVLLYGPPGTGKTMACRALAKESGARMLQIQSSSLQRSQVGETEKLLAGMFSLARRIGPCVLFIDELDALFGTRDGMKPIWHTSLLTQFMQEMEGLLSADLNRKAGVVVIGATNRPQDIDVAVLRRLPQRVLVDLPTMSERQEILNMYLEGEKKDESVNVRKLAGRTSLFSGSDLRHLVLAAVLAALKEMISDDAAAQQPLPERVLSAKHFEQALREISPSCATNTKGVEELRSWGGRARQRATPGPR